MVRLSPKAHTALSPVAATAAAAAAIVDVILPHDLYGTGPLLTSLACVGIFAALRPLLHRLAPHERVVTACSPAEGAQLRSTPTRFLANVGLCGFTRYLPEPVIATLLITLTVRYRFGTDKSLVQDIISVLVSAPTYSIVVFALSPIAFVCVQAGAAIMTWRRSRASNAPFNTAMILIRYFGFALCLALLYFAVFKMGPPAQFCKVISRDFPALPLLSAERIRSLPGLASSLPYDAVTSSDGESLVVSLKQTNGEPGGVVKVSLETGDVISVQKTPGLSPGTNSFPERIAASRRRREIYALVYGPGHYRLFVFSDEPHILRFSRSMSLPAEPVSLLVDEERQQLWIDFVAESPTGAIAYDLESLQPAASTDYLGATQYMATVDGTNQLLITTLYRRFKIAVVDRDHTQPTRKLQYSWPLVGLTLTKGMEYAVASSPLTRSLVVFNMDTGQVSRKLAISGGLADLDHDPQLPLVFVAHYSGDINIVDTDAMQIVAWYNIGYLLRSLFFDAQRRRVYACSGCGVFAFDPTSGV